ncbi:hypothetical protein [Pseudomonas tohonis]|uniref:hypothetical protein n=1 Tax=Pseudomonas tohonis TaxID=2725477 RepID=UPI0022F02424|nr:hypothetical protein [Pseudomonas tohonis]
MKLHKVLTVGGTPYQLVKDEVRLNLRSPGRAAFTITAEDAVRGLVTLDIGYNDSALQRHFLGHVERCTAASGGRQVLFCRELTNVLALPLPMNLRHVDLRQVLAEVSNRTGLRFRVPDQAYASTKAPFFYNLAAGYQALDSLARVFDIPDFIWQQQGDGEVFVGSWADSYWGSRTALELPAELFDEYQGNQSAMVAALPGVRPGLSINQGERITSVTLADTQMAIRWKT